MNNGDGYIKEANNLSENAIRPFTVGRRNWLFSDSQAGADASAVIYSIVETAKANDINIYHSYICYLYKTKLISKNEFSIFKYEIERRC